MNTNEFFLTSNDLISNRDQLITGINLMKNETNIENYFETNTITSYFDYLYRFTQANFGNSNVLEICELFLENDFHLLLVKLNEYFLKICENLSLSSSDKISGRKIDILSDAQSVTNFLFAYSKRFCVNYFKNGGLRPLIGFLGNQSFVDMYCQERGFQNILWNLGFLSVESDLYKNEWFDLNAIDILLKIAVRDKKFKRSAFSIVIRILNDNQISTLNDIPEILTLYIKILNRAANFMEKTQVKREKMEFDDDDDQITRQYDVFCVPHDDGEENVTGPITGTMSILYKIAVNDKIKYDLFVKYNLKDPLRVIIFKGSDIERQHALNLLAQLSFDPQVLDILSRDDELISEIKQLSKDASLYSKAIPRICNQIIWSLSNNIKNNKEIRSEVGQRDQIFMSYSYEFRDSVVKVKNILESAGFLICADIDEKARDLELISRSIENSKLVLVFVSEKYRQSINCQAEAQYAFKLKKPIIPLIMQNDYENVGGWLGKLLIGRSFIDFTKFTFEDSIEQLLRFIKADLNQPDAKTKPEHDATLQCKIGKENKTGLIVRKWSEDEVEKWFKTEGNMQIFDELKPCDGELLYQLYKMKENAPKFFYNFINLKNNVDSQSIIEFTNNLRKLFINDGE